MSANPFSGVKSERRALRNHALRIRNLERRPLPTWVADWVYVGAGGGAPAFQNGWANSGGSYVPMRYRVLPYKDEASDQPGLEIQGSVTGGTPGTAIFTLPFTVDYDLHLAASDDAGAFVVFTVQQSGDVVDGFV